MAVSAARHHLFRCFGRKLLLVRSGDLQFLKVCGEEVKSARLKIAGLPLRISGPDLVAAIGDIFGAGAVACTDVVRFNATEVEVSMGANSPILPLQILVRHEGGFSFASVSFESWVVDGGSPVGDSVEGVGGPFGTPLDLVILGRDHAKGSISDGADSVVPRVGDEERRSPLLLQSIGTFGFQSCVADRQLDVLVRDGVSDGEELQNEMVVGHREVPESSCCHESVAEQKEAFQVAGEFCQAAGGLIRGVQIGCVFRSIPIGCSDSQHKFSAVVQSSALGSGGFEDLLGVTGFPAEKANAAFFERVRFWGCRIIFPGQR